MSARTPADSTAKNAHKKDRKMLEDQFSKEVEAETSFVDVPNLATSRNPHNLLDENEAEIQSKAVFEPLAFTVITSHAPTRLTKVIGVDAVGKMTKQTAAAMTKGHAKVINVDGLAKLREVLDSLTPANAVTWGTTTEAETLLCTQGDEDSQERLGAVPRSRAQFKFTTAPGVMMLDHDGLPDGELSGQQFRERLIEAAPCLADAPMLWRPSASAGCVRPDGTTLSGLTRHRLYIPVTDASKIPEAGKALVSLLWANPGDGWIEVGKAGQQLTRCLVDASVWQPERLDFAGPSVLVDGVTRAGVDGVIYGDQAAQFDLVELIDAATPTVKKKATAEQKTARAAVASECATARATWVSEHAPRLAQSRGIKQQQAANILDRAALHHVLMGDFELTCADGTIVSVGQILDNPHRWHNTRFADPLEPGTDRRVSVARLLNGTRPDVYSHAHGGMKYELRRQSARVQLGRGMRIDATDAVLGVLRERSELFDFGPNAIAYVADGRATPVSRDWLVDHCGRVAEFYTIKTERDEDGGVKSTREVPEDAPTWAAAAIIAKNGGRNFRKLTAVITAPTLRLDGSIFDAPGHDEPTGLMYVTNQAYPPAVPTAPTPAQALDALAALWHPIRLFPFVDDVSRGVTLSAMLAAPLRASLPTCPATGFDAPAAGTGKTLLAKLIGALATGGEVAVLPPTNDEDECRKRLFAALRGGAKVILWDNVREPLGNGVFDSFLTTSLFSDRVLGVSETVELPNRAVFIVSGNNLVLTGDTHRRVLLARLDAELESPFKREFAFDPLELVIAERQRLVVAALTIVRAYITAGSPKAAPGRIASFEHWDDLVRQPLCWLRDIAAHSGRADLPTFDDPALAIDQAGSSNPETAKLAALLNAWLNAFGNTGTTPKQAINAATDGFNADSVLFDALDEIAGQNGKINVRMLGRWLEKHSDCLRDGLRLKLASKAHGLKHWVVLKSKSREKQDENSKKVVKVATGCEIQDVDETTVGEVFEVEL